jgi:hypothetical protein
MENNDPYEELEIYLKQINVSITLHTMLIKEQQQQQRVSERERKKSETNAIP